MDASSRARVQIKSARHQASSGSAAASFRGEAPINNISEPQLESDLEHKSAVVIQTQWHALVTSAAYEERQEARVSAGKQEPPPPSKLKLGFSRCAAKQQRVFVRPVSRKPSSVNQANKLKSMRSATSPFDASGPIAPTTYVMLLFLREDTFSGVAGDELASQVRAARSAGVQLVLVHDLTSCAFDTVIENTPRDLLESGLYSDVAIDFVLGRHEVVSTAYFAKKLGAQPKARPVGMSMDRPLSSLAAARCTSWPSSPRPSIYGRRVSGRRPPTQHSADISGHGARLSSTRDESPC
uniref:Uncharacterized protein n=1 Tax=Chrysotila carterae TaxID=13221 RepID=A0A7S4BYU2_CHRCT